MISIRDAPVYGVDSFNIKLEKTRCTCDTHYYLTLESNELRQVIQLFPGFYGEPLLSSSIPGNKPGERKLIVTELRNETNIDIVMRGEFSFWEDSFYHLAGSFLEPDTEEPQLFEEYLSQFEAKDISVPLSVMDGALTKSFQFLYIPDSWSVLSNPSSSRPKETLMHFAARLDLVNFASLLLSKPGGVQALSIRNRQDVTPIELANIKGNKRVSDLFHRVQRGEYIPPSEPTKHFTSSTLVTLDKQQGAVLTSNFATNSHSLETDVDILHKFLTKRFRLANTFPTCLVHLNKSPSFLKQLQSTPASSTTTTATDSSPTRDPLNLSISSFTSREGNSFAVATSSSQSSNLADSFASVSSSRHTDPADNFGASLSSVQFDLEGSLSGQQPVRPKRQPPPPPPRDQSLQIDTTAPKKPVCHIPGPGSSDSEFPDYGPSAGRVVKSHEVTPCEESLSYDEHEKESERPSYYRRRSLSLSSSQEHLDRSESRENEFPKNGRSEYHSMNDLDDIGMSIADSKMPPTIESEARDSVPELERCLKEAMKADGNTSMGTIPHSKATYSPRRSSWAPQPPEAMHHSNLRKMRSLSKSHDDLSDEEETTDNQSEAEESGGRESPRTRDHTELESGSSDAPIDSKDDDEHELEVGGDDDVDSSRPLTGMSLRSVGDIDLGFEQDHAEAVSSVPSLPDASVATATESDSDCQPDEVMLVKATVPSLSALKSGSLDRHSRRSGSKDTSSSAGGESIFSKITKLGSYRPKGKNAKYKKRNHDFEVIPTPIPTVSCHVCNKPIKKGIVLKCKSCLLIIHESSCSDSSSLRRTNCTRFDTLDRNQVTLLKLSYKESSFDFYLPEDLRTSNDQHIKSAGLFEKNISASMKPSYSFNHGPKAGQILHRNGDSAVMLPRSKSSSMTRQTSASSLRKLGLASFRLGGEDSGSEYATSNGMSASQESLQESMIDNGVDDDLNELRNTEQEAWVYTVPEHVLNSLGKREVDRQNRIWDPLRFLYFSEFIRMENIHYRNLRVIQRVFYSRLLQTLPYLDKSVLDTLFPCLDSLLTVHKRFSETLHERQISNEHQIVDSIADILIAQFGNDWEVTVEEVYAEFCSRLLDVKQQTDILKEDSKFVSFMKQCSMHPASNKHDLFSFFTIVAQTITQYVLHIEKIIKYTTDEGDRRMLETALDMCRQISARVDEHVGRKQNQQKLRSTISRMDSSASVDFRNRRFRKQDLMTNKRQLLYSANIYLMNARRKKVEVFCLLLNDMVVILQDTGAKYRFCTTDGKHPIIPLCSLVVRKQGDTKDPRGFFIINQDAHKSELYHLVCKTASDRDKWFAQLQEACRRISPPPSPAISQHSCSTVTPATIEDASLSPILDKKDLDEDEYIDLNDTDSLVRALEDIYRMDRNLLELLRRRNRALSKLMSPDARELNDSHSVTLDKTLSVAEAKQLVEEARKQAYLLLRTLGEQHVDSQAEDEDLESRPDVGLSPGLPRRTTTFNGFDSTRAERQASKKRYNTFIGAGDVVSSNVDRTSVAAHNRLGSSCTAASLLVSVPANEPTHTPPSSGNGSMASSSRSSLHLACEEVDSWHNTVLCLMDSLDAMLMLVTQQETAISTMKVQIGSGPDLASTLAAAVADGIQISGRSDRHKPIKGLERGQTQYKQLEQLRTLMERVTSEKADLKRREQLHEEFIMNEKQHLENWKSELTEREEKCKHWENELKQEKDRLQKQMDLFEQRQREQQQREQMAKRQYAQQSLFVPGQAIHQRSVSDSSDTGSTSTAISRPSAVQPYSSNSLKEPLDPRNVAQYNQFLTEPTTQPMQPTHPLRLPDNHATSANNRNASKHTVVVSPAPPIRSPISSVEQNLPSHLSETAATSSSPDLLHVLSPDKTPSMQSAVLKPSSSGSAIGSRSAQRIGVAEKEHTQLLPPQLSEPTRTRQQKSRKHRFKSDSSSSKKKESTPSLLKVTSMSMKTKASSSDSGLKQQLPMQLAERSSPHHQSNQILNNQQQISAIDERPRLKNTNVTQEQRQASGTSTRRISDIQYV